MTPLPPTGTEKYQRSHSTASNESFRRNSRNSCSFLALAPELPSVRVAFAPLSCYHFVMRKPRASRAACGLLWVLVAGTALAAEPLPSGDQMIQRVMDHSAALAAATNAPAWAYDKRTVMEKLDGDAKVEERTEKLYRVQIIRGVPFSRLIKQEGRELTEAEIQKENQREAAFQKRLSGRDPKKAVAQREALVTKDLVERYQYQSLRRELIHGRQTVVVSFAAKPGKSDDSIQDRVLNRLSGTVWVDEATADVARLEVRLTKGFSMGLFGVLGSIKDCRMDLASRPMTDGTWLPEKTKVSMSARMLLSNVRFQMEETSSNYALEPAS